MVEPLDRRPKTEYITQVIDTHLMKYLVKLYVGGTTWDEEVIATNPKDARETALARNPKAKVMGVNVKF